MNYTKFVREYCKNNSGTFFDVSKLKDTEFAEVPYIRNRNLFYVCCSRPKKRLFIFISIPVDDVFRNYLKNMVGKENIVTYKDFIEKGNRNI